MPSRPVTSSPELPDQPARDIGLEPTQTAAHGIERARRLVELADAAARQVRKVVQLQLLDLAGGIRQALDWLRHASTQPEGGDHGDDQRYEA